jgi:hypothetical protein
MSGILAAARKSGCCCQNQDDDGEGGGGGGGGICSDTSPGAESDRATTAISISANFIANQSDEYNGRTCAAPAPLNPSICQPSQNPYACGNIPSPPPPTYTCYQYDGLSNANSAGSCRCTTIGNCFRCAAVSWLSNGGSAIALQTSPNAREWLTYQTASPLLPDARIAQWSWQAGYSGVTTYTEQNSANTQVIVRRACPRPAFRGLSTPTPPTSNDYVHGSIVGPAGSVITSTDISGQYVNTSDRSLATSRFGNPDIGPVYVLMRVKIRYYSNFSANLVSYGAGWLAEVFFHFVPRETHLEYRDRALSLAGGTVNRWDWFGGFFPAEGNLPPTQIVPNLSEITPEAYPWYLWSPCTGQNDTVRGIYTPIQVGTPNAFNNATQRTRTTWYFTQPTICQLGGARVIDATMINLIVS